MAIFYKHIKGCGTSATGISSDLWTYLVWRDTQDKINNDAIGAPESAHFKYAPSIKVAASQSGPQYDLGRIITSDAVSQYINKSFTFKENVVMEKQLYLKNTSSTSGTYIEDTGSMFQLTFRDDTNIQAYSGKVYFNVGVSLNKNVSASGNVQLKNGLYVGDDTTYPVSSGNIKADNKCEAKYFNAISDQRAKENITLASFSALSAINSLPIYTFNYKTKPEETTIGLIAQEAAEYDLDSFNMVDNLTATGENNDFMQMKESKLVYVLWKAVQELSAEVESLKQQLASK